MSTAISQVNNVQTAQPVKTQDVQPKVSEADSFKSALKEADNTASQKQTDEVKTSKTDVKNVTSDDNKISNSNVKSADKSEQNIQAENTQKNNQNLQLKEKDVDVQTKNQILAVEKQVALDKERLLVDKNVEFRLDNNAFNKDIEKQNLAQEYDAIAAFLNEQDAQQNVTSLIGGNLAQNALNPLDASLQDLHSKISAINSLGTISSSSKNLIGSIKMSSEDTNFFINMVENQNNNNFQTHVMLNNAQHQIMFADSAKAQVLQNSAAVSQALIDKLQESMNTNKAFRVDFDKDVAVIIKVDQNGVLSANFIPGSSAVEQYLRNNIEYLKQTFDSENLPYNKLTYGEHKQDRNKREDKESS